MITHSITSSNISGSAWEDETLYLTFNKGGVYKYEGVSVEVYNDFIAAPSQGKFFHSTIKPNYAAVKQSV
jgi:hypothetical protein